jgi:hypothetical protein
MRIALVPLLLLAGFRTEQAEPPHLPTLTPFFMSREVEGGPAFFVECKNTTAAAISSGSETWPVSRTAVRVDGTILDDKGRIGPGLTQDIPPGGTWRGIIELRQALGRNSYATALGANVRIPIVVPLRAGRHTISVRCGGVWAPELPFYWEQ